MTARRHADLPLVQERSERSGRRGHSEVGTREDDQGVVAAELEMRTFQVLGAERTYASAGLGRTCEGDDAYFRSRDDGFAYLGASGQELQQPFGQASLLEDPDQ